MTYWTARNTSGNKWQFEDGWKDLDKAIKGAAYYRREYRRKCVVVPVPDGFNNEQRAAELRRVVREAVQS